jgi:hypothetical protein
MKFRPKKRLKVHTKKQVNIQVELVEGTEEQVSKNIQTIAKNLNAEQIALIAQLTKSIHKNTAISELEARKHLFVI